MLSTETPPHPSYSSKSSALKTDERASGQFASFQEAAPVGFVEAQAPNFSIRDYVYSSRSKSIGTNWPFPKYFLKLCLKHGVSDLLPPFEPPDLVRAQCCRNTVESKQLEAEKISSQVDSLDLRDVCTESIEPKSCLPSDEFVVDSSDQDRYPLPEERKLAVDQGDILDDKLTDGDAEIVSTVTSHNPIERISYQFSKLHVNRNLSEASERKCRLALELCAISEAMRPEDIASTSSTVSDPMASKVCPVCKIFSSSSNTTLNAHIDQCLSMESNTEQVLANISKLKVKPRKKRLMEDIYATAPYCTLEDLDRRNGTNWATDLSLVAPAGEGSTETKRPKLSLVASRDDVNEEGAVYVDSNGIKLRILSKFNDTPSVMPREEFNPKKQMKEKQMKEIKEEKSLLVSKKMQFSSKYLKYMKVKPPSKKLRSSFELCKGEMMQEAPEGDHQADTPQEKEESQFQTVSPRDQVRSSGSATLRQWVCSKRSDLPKKINKRDNHKSSEKPRLLTRIPLSESHQPDLGNTPVARSHIQEFSRSCEALTSSPKAKIVDFLQTTGSGKKKTPNPPLFSSRWSSGSNLTNDLIPASSPSSKIKEIHIGNTQKADNSSETAARPSEICHPSLKAKNIATLKKKILVERPSFTLEASNGDVSEEVSNSKKFRKHRSILVTSKRGGERPGKTIKTCRPNFSTSVTRPRTDVIGNQMSPRRCNIPESEQEREDVATMEEQKHDTSGAECHDTEVVTKPSIEKVDGDHVTREAFIFYKPAPDSIAIVEPKPSEQNVESIIGNESNDEPTAQSLLDHQEIQCCDVTHDEVEFRAEFVESQAETVSAQESSACLTSHGEVGLEIPQENSSITSIRIISPISTASTISPPSPKDSQSKESIGGSPRRDVERKNQKVEMVLVEKEPQQLSDNQPCCCSKREGLSREFQFLRQSIMAGPVLTSKGKQISNLYIAPSTSSCTSYPSLRTNAMESPESISSKSFSDSAVKFPDCSGLRSPSPSTTTSTPNSVLRLMGKNLMVVKKEQSAQLPNVHPSSSENPSPPLGFASIGNFVNQESFWYHHYHQLPVGSSVLGQVPSMADHQKPAVSRAPYMEEVIIIDDSQETDPEPKASLVNPSSTLPTFRCSNPMVQQRPFSCLPPQSQFISRDLSGGFRHSLSNACPREFANPIKQGSSASEGSVPSLLPSPFLFRSPSMYYSQIL